MVSRRRRRDGKKHSRGGTGATQRGACCAMQLRTINGGGKAREERGGVGRILQLCRRMQKRYDRLGGKVSVPGALGIFLFLLVPC